MQKKQVKDVLRSYRSAVASLQPERLLQCFAENAVVEDPVGTPPVIGHHCLRQLFENWCSKWKKVSLDPLLTIIFFPKVVVNQSISATDYNKKIVKYDVISSYEFSEDGKIVKMRVLFEREDLERQQQKASTLSFS